MRRRTESRIAVILAGGASSRMGGVDKALVSLGGERLIDRVVARLAPQADRLMISGASDYGTGLETIADAPDAPPGPAGGLLSVCGYLRREGSAAAFLTAPVDGPFLPPDLAERLAAAAPAIAADDNGVHATFAYWTLASLERAAESLAGEASFSLQRLAQAAGARVVRWPGADAFANINTPDDLARFNGPSGG